MKHHFPKLPKDVPADLRPLGARALTSAMDTLRPYLPESRVLDLFAGQGRFGTAAALEGARRIVFVEKDPKVVRLLSKEIQKPFFPKETELIAQDALKYLSQTDEVFDIVFGDPPFAWWEKTPLDALCSAVIKQLHPSSIFLVKCPSRMIISIAVPGFTVWKSSSFGDSKLVYFTYGPTEKKAPVPRV